MLKVGMAADIIIVDMNKPHLVPVHNQMSHLVYAAKGSDVRTTIVDGHILMEDGKVLSMDQNKVIEQAVHAAKRLALSVKQ
jgi:5-methylthioadenosine/S-adenosylhomocysteine deaminase